jgi:glutaconyl-CoA/methylmalonyl-CoA decarboxylase subunit gamma
MRRYRIEVRGREFLIDVQELAADEFEVVVGSETYDVMLASDEELPEARIHPSFLPASATAPAAAGAGASAAAPGGGGAAAAPAKAVVTPRAPAAPAPRKAAAGSGASLNAPMPGVIIAVCVEAGATVTRGQEIAVLDAMKMHNSIKSPRAGVVREVCVTPGHAVGHGDPIIRYEDA